MERRIRRALSQRIYLIKRYDNTFNVAGLTNHYTVDIDSGTHEHTCSCPDFEQRQNFCKHIFFVLFRVLGFDKEEWVQNKSNVELAKPKELREEPPPNPKKQKRQDDVFCPICYELYTDTPKDTVTVCDACGGSFHSSCMKIWMRHSPHQTCPLCRHSHRSRRFKRQRVS